MADPRHAARTLANTVVMITFLLALPLIGAQAGMVKIHVGDTWRHAVQFYSKEKGLTPEATERWIRQQERITGNRLLDDIELPEGAELDFYKVRNSKDPSKRVDFLGRGKLVDAYSWIGRHYQEVLFSLLSTDKCDDALALLRQAREQGYMIVPAAMSGPAASVRPAAAQTIRAIVIIPEFPHWVDPQPISNGDTTRSAPGSTDMYFLSNSDTTAPRNYPGAGNAPYEPSEYNRRDYYFDSPGGRIVNGIPMGMQYNAGAWWGNNPGATSSPDGHPRAGGPSYKPEVTLQNDWFNTVFNKSNPDSLYNYFYQNTHGHISIEGDYSNVVGWVTDHHILDRWPYPNGCYYAVQPGTPLLRPTPATALDPILGGGRTFQPIVRASLHSAGITLLFRTDAMGQAFTRNSIVDISVYQTQDINSATAGTQRGTVSISNATTNTTVVKDPWDNRRVTLLNNGWEFVDQGDATKRISYQMAPLYSWSIDVNVAGVGVCRWSSNHIGDAVGNPDQANPCYGDQNEGCGAMPNTTFTAADLYVNNTLQSAPYPSSYYYIGSAPGNRLLSFCYYTHNHSFGPNSAYQLRRLLTNGYRDDIAGSTEGTDLNQDRADRPYPFDHDMSDHANVNNGNVLSSDPSPSGQHTAARMRADVHQTLTDQGISYLGYDLEIFLFPDKDQSEGDPNASITPHATGNIITVPEGVSLGTLRHETNHVFGAVDLYDNDLYTNSATPPPVPRKVECNMAGPYSLMAAGVRIDPWHKIQSWMRNGPWVEVSNVVKDLGLTQIWQIEQTLRDPVVLKLPAHPLSAYAAKYIEDHGVGSKPPGYPGTVADFAQLADPSQWKEYFLVENRNLTGAQYFGDASPRGLYIWHVDERNIGGFQKSEETPTVIPVQADGLDELTKNLKGNPGNLAGDPFPGSQNNRSFRERSVVLPNGARSPVSWSHGIPEPSQSPPQTILPGTPTDSFVRITNIGDPGNPMTAEVYVQPAEIKVTGTSLVPPPAASPDYQAGDVFYRVRQGTRNFPLELLTLDNDADYPNLSTRDVTVDQIKVYEVGTSLRDTNVTLARLYEDTNGNGKLDVNEDANSNGILDPYEDHNGNGILDTTDVDKLLKTAPVSGDYILFTNLGYVVPLRSGATPPVNLIVAYDISDTATISPAITLASELTDYTFVSPNPPGAVQDRVRTTGTSAANAGYIFGTSLFPITSNSAMVIEDPDTLTVESTNLVPQPEPAPVLQGATDTPMMQLKLTANHDSIILSQLTVKQIEDAVGGTDVSVVRLWWDKNNSANVDAGDQLLGQAAIAGGAGAGVATIAGLTFQVNAGAPQYLILTTNIPSGAALGKKIQLEITDGTAFVPQTIPGQPADIISSANAPWRSGVYQVNIQNQPPYAPPTGVGVGSGYNYTQDWFPPNAPAPGSALPIGALPQFKFPRGRDLSNDPAGGPGGRGTGLVDPDITVDTPSTVTYEVDFSQDSAFPPAATQTRTVAASSANDPVVTFTPPALSSGTWYWRARTVDTYGQKSANSSPVFQFTVITAPNVPTLLYPLAGDSPVTASMPVYRWTMGTDPDTPPAEMRTVIEVDDNSDFSSIRFRAVSTPGSSTSSGWTIEYYDTTKYASAIEAQTLNSGITYYWRARARDKYDLESPNTPTAQFTTAGNLAPGTPVAPFAPSGGTVVTTANPVLSWGRSTDPDPADTAATLTYYVELDTNDDWTDGVNLIVSPAGGQAGPGIATTPVTMTVMLPNLADNTQYYWRVRAKDQGGLYSDWSPTQTFWVNTTNNPPNTPTGLTPTGRVGPSATAPTVLFRPTLRCPATTDPDTFPPAAGPTLTYIFRIKKGPALPWNPDTSWDFQGTPAAGVTQWTTPPLPWDPVTDPIWYWAVKAVDPQGASSAWAIESFQLDRDPNAPPPDNPLDPADWLPEPGSVVQTSTPTLQFPVVDSLNPAFVIDPDDNAVDPRASFTYTIQLATDAGFTTNLQTITGIPPSNPLVPTAPVAYTLTAAQALTPGTWYWRVTTKDSFGLAAGTYDYATGTMTAPKWSATYSFRVVSAPTPPTGPFSPSGGVTTGDTTPTFRWTLGTDVDTPPSGLSTVIELADNAAFDSPFPLLTATGGAQTIDQPTELAVGRTYYWRAKTVDSDGLESAWTATQTFVVGNNQKPYPPVAPFAPTGSQVLTTATPTLSWGAATDPNPEDVPATLRYQAQLRIGDANWGAAAGNILITSGDTTATGVTSLKLTATTPALADNGHYYWRVRTLDQGGLYSDWSPTQDFYLNLVNNNPNAPSTGFSPASGTRIAPVQVVPTVVYRTTLACDPTTDPDTFPPGPPPTLTYEFVLKYDAPAGWNPNLPAYASDYDYQLTAPAGTTSVTTPTLTYDWVNDKAWSWAVRAIDTLGGTSSWSAVQLLRLDRAPASPNLPAADWLPTAGQAVVDNPLLQFPAGSDPDAAEGDTVDTLSYVIELSQDNFATTARTYAITAAGNGDPNAPNRLQFTVPVALAAGSWQWRVTTVDKGNLPAAAPSAIHTFVVNHAPLPPTNLAPDGVPTTSTQPTLTWTLGTDPDLNDIPSTLTTVIEVDDDPTTNANGSFTSPEYVQGISGPTASYLIPGALTPGVKYYWHGKTIDNKGFESAWSATASFTVANNTSPNPPAGVFTVAGFPNFPSQPMPPIPPTALEINTNNPMIQWPAATDPDTPASQIHYIIELDVNDDWGDMNNLLGAANVTPAGVPQFQVPAGILQDNGHYYYRVRAVDSDGQVSDWSASHDFWVNLGNDAPLAPNSGFSPTNGQTTGVRPTLTCNHAVDPDPSDQLTWPTNPPRSYVFQLRPIDGNFGAGYTYQFTVSNISNPVTVSLDLATAPGAVDLTDKTNWFWRVRCIDQHGAAGAWSAAQGFYVDANNLPPTLAPPSGSAALALVPQLGTLNPPTHFEFHVIYSDPEGDAPVTGVWVELDGNPAKRFLMQQLDPTRTTRADYQSGVEFVYGVEANDPAVGKGPHTFQFQTFGAVWPSTPGTGPIVNVPSTLRLTDATWTSVPAPPFKGYEEGQTVYIEVTDTDQDTDPLTRQAVQVVLSVNGTTETESVTLLETDINTGVFRGSIPMRGAAGAINNGVLNVVAGASGATITATYTDQYSPSLDTQVVSALVLDQTPPAPAQPALSATSGPNGVTIDLNWSPYDQVSQDDVTGSQAYQIFCELAPFSDVTGLTPVTTIGAFSPGTPGAPKTYTLTAARSGATAVSLQNDTTYYVAVVPIDEVPNRVTAVTGLAVHTVDSTPPTLGSTSPGNGAQRNADIVFHVLDAGSGVNPASVHAYMSINGGPETEISGTPEWTVTGTPADLTCTYNPPTDFAWNDSVTIRVTADDNQPAPVGPNHLNASYSFLVLLDTTGPTIPAGGISPAPGATGVAVTAPVSFRITDDLSGVDPSSVKVTRNGVDITSECGVTPASGIPGAYDVRFPATGPGTNLWNETVTITVEVKDLAGNPINPPTNSQTWSFEVAKDTDGPVVSNLSPAAGTSTAAPTDPISCRITDAVSGVDPATLEMYVNSIQVPAANLVVTPIGGGITVTYTPAPGTYSYGEAMTVRVVARDLAGNLVQDESPVIGVGNGFEWSFTMSAAPRYRILGTITDGTGGPVGGVTVTVYQDVPSGAVLGTALTDGNGNYTVTGLLGGTACRIVPTLSEYDFTPTELHATVGSADVRDQNFVAARRTYTISGTVTVGGVGIAGVVVSDGLRSAITGADGKYTITGVPSGRYTVTPTLAYYAFRPTERTVTIPVPGANQTGIDFEAVAETFTISGTVRDYDGNRVQGVRVTDGTHSAITNESGLYILSDINAGTVSLSASKAGYTFTPATQSVTVPPNATGIDFVAYQAFTTSFTPGLNFIGVPCYPETEDATTVFGTSLLARWNPSAATPGYVTPASTSGLDVLAVRPGRGFWVNLPSSDLVVGGRPVSTTRPFTMTLGPAWNMAANPFNIPLAFANITPGLAGSMRPYGYVYQATAPRGYLLISAVPGVNVARTQINPWEGIWLRCTTSSATLTITPSASASDATAAPKALDLGAGGYAIPICARTAGSADRTTSVGVSPALSANLELENPPMAPQTVDVYLASEDGRYLSQQIRATTTAAQSWNFVVVSNEAGADVEVSLPDLSQVPNNLSVYLTDLETGKRMYARTLTAYSFKPAAVGAGRQFKLEVVPRSEAGLVVSGASASVGARGAVVSYNVSKDCRVTVRVTNIAGRVVRVLSTDVAAAKGVNTTAWDLRSAAGTPVPAGRYLIQVEATSEDGQRVSAVVPAMVRR